MTTCKKTFVLEVYYPANDQDPTEMGRVLRPLLASPYFVQMELARTQAALTPTADQIAEAKSILGEADHRVALNIMVYPGTKDFEHTDDEIASMREFIERHTTQADGFVVGALRNGQVNSSAMKDFVDAAGGKPVTFHSAFDLIDPQDIKRSLDALKEAGVQKIMISGARDGRFVDTYQHVLQIQKIAEGYGFEVMVRGGIVAPQF